MKAITLSAVSLSLAAGINLMLHMAGGVMRGELVTGAICNIYCCLKGCAFNPSAKKMRHWGVMCAHAVCAALC